MFRPATTVSLLSAIMSFSSFAFADDNLPEISLNLAPKQQEEMTLSIIKPDAVASNHIGEIISRFEKNGLQVVGIKMIHLTKEQAGKFYEVHKSRPFYPELTAFMSSKPIVVLALQGKNAIAKNREMMGATDPSKATAGTLRKDFATSVTQNAVHGSDSLDTAKEEIAFFFTKDELFPHSS